MMRRDQEDERKRSVIAEYTSRGEENHNNGDLKKAIENYLKAYEHARDIRDDKIERLCALNLGAAFIGANNPEDGLKYLHKATPPDNERDEPSNGALFFNKALGFEKLGDNKQALENFRKAHEEYKVYERYNTAVLTQCLEKCLRIYEAQKQFKKAADICKELADELEGLDKASKLCDRITFLRHGGFKDESWSEAIQLKQSIDEMELVGTECLQAGKILNDIGLSFTLVSKYDEATGCFENALHLIRSSQTTQDQLEAVVLQNLGAAYNFMGEFQRAVKLHEDAIEKYGKSSNRNSQGQCFTNLAYALTQCRNFREAELAFHHALQAAKDSSDQHMEWQALEGLGAVNFRQGKLQAAVDFYMSALQRVGSHVAASERIKNKLLHATQLMAGVQISGLSHTADIQVANQTVLFEEHARVVPTPRETYQFPTLVEGKVPIVPERQHSMVEYEPPPVMASIQEIPAKPTRRFLPVRKAGSFGPHTPKMARGLSSSLGYNTDSPRFMDSSRRPSHQPQLLEEQTESSSSSSDDSETDSDTDSDQTMESPKLMTSEKVESIFRRPESTTKAPDGVDEEVDEDLHSRYQAELQKKEQNEDEDVESSSEESDSSDSSDDTDSDTDVDVTPVNDNRNTNAPPPLPTQSPPITGTFGTPGTVNGTYLQPVKVETTAEVHQPSVQPSVSSTRVKTSQEDAGSQSPRRQDSDGEDDSDSDEPGSPQYSTVNKTQQLRQQDVDKGNVPPSSRRRRISSSGRKSENFFEDTDRSSIHSNNDMQDSRAAGNEDEGPYNTLNFQRDGEGGSGHIDDLPRGQRNRILEEYHQQRRDDPPPLPERGNAADNKPKTKTCTIM